MYSVQGVRVSLDPSRGWQCTCKAHAEGRRCVHVEQAHVFREMRGSKRDDDTIELEFSAEELQALRVTAAVEHTDPPPDAAVSRSRREPRPSPWAAVLAAAGLAGLSSGITYLATGQADPIRVAENRVPRPLAAPTPEAPPPPPVRFVNPFDATEVFEFPRGMSENDVREAVAELLLDRARERLAASADTQRRNRDVAHREKPVRAARLAEGG